MNYKIIRPLMVLPLVTLICAAEMNEPDNTARNERDRNHQNKTPFDQGTSESDVSITKQIRQEIMKQKYFSTNAQNVKVITKEGHVVLRGPVDIEDEKSKIDSIARSIAGVTVVHNELEVIKK